ncbi:MAG: hypothetical protein CM1200mP35_09440 [Chloroflexota bacterium]|nr:MAG: hypothetical protein CM1200mP35_09440 [Chloroflexota bacterium]
MFGYRVSRMAGTDANNHPEAFINVEKVKPGELARGLSVIYARVIVSNPWRNLSPP